jgi:hypothetical protein
LGVDPQAVDQGLKQAVPAVVTGVQERAATEEGRHDIFARIQPDDGSVLDQPIEALSPSNEDLTRILGGQAPAVAEQVAQGAGLSPEKSQDLLSMVAPLVMGALGRQQSAQGLDASGLGQMLQGIDLQQLAGMAKFLDRDGDGDIMDDVQNLLGGLMQQKPANG